MLRADFFRRLGVFVAEDFLDAAACARLRQEMDSGIGGLASVWRDGEGVVDETVRSVRYAHVASCSQAAIQERLLGIRPALEEHFQVELERCQTLQFLVYREGAFYDPHRDSSDQPDAHPDFPRRKVSTVLFLNGESHEATPDSYTGGSLALYGVLDQPPWSRLGFPLAGHQGLLVAFPAGMLHGVQPVRAGERYTVVNWFE